MRRINSIFTSFTFIVLVVLLASAARAVEVDPDILKQLEHAEAVNVIVVLKEPSLRTTVTSTADFETTFKSRKNAIAQDQADVLENLKVKTNHAGLGIASPRDYDLDIRHRYSTIPGFSGKITKAGLRKLQQEDLVDKIIVDRPVSIALDVSVPQINGDDAHSL